MNVHAWDDLFHRAQNITIVKRRQTVRQSALNADFGRAHLPGLHAPSAPTCSGVKKIRIGFARPPAEGAKFAANETNIGEVDVAIHYIRHKIPGKFAAQIDSLQPAGRAGRRPRHSPKAGTAPRVSTPPSRFPSPARCAPRTPVLIRGAMSDHPARENSRVQTATTIGPQILLHERSPKQVRCRGTNQVASASPAQAGTGNHAQCMPGCEPACRKPIPPRKPVRQPQPQY